ncbi:hypothetical protein JOS77_30800 [Chromobacterium haemolyticum]|nr:hypothetical protein JOS77_30800 [Chromobacterium haemolyticum]
MTRGQGDNPASLSLTTFNRPGLTRQRHHPFGLNLETEVERFVAHYQAKSETRADLKAWEAQFRKWMLDQQQYNADRDKVTESRMQTKQSSRAADCAALGVGSQYREVPYLEAANEFR